MDLPELSASEWAAWLALPPAWIAFAWASWSGVRRFRAGRRAEVVSWLEHHGNSTSYCALLNRGPAVAREVGVAYTNRDASEVDFTVTQPWSLPLDRLTPDDPIYLHFVHLPGTIPPVMTVTTSWKDGRRRRQSRSGAISARPGPPAQRMTPADLRRNILERSGW
jgi:hypothetical protein